MKKRRTLLETTETPALTPGRATVYGAGVVGGIDFAYASVGVAWMGRSWYQAWQGVSSALLGRDSFAGGVPTVLLGILLHFIVATCIVGVYVASSRWIPVLGQKSLLCGLVYGVVAFFVMNEVVIPLTRIGPRPFVWSAFNIGGLFVHTLLLGPAAAYFARRASQPDDRGN